MDSASGLHDSMVALNRDQWAVAWVLEAVRTGVNLDEVTAPFAAWLAGRVPGELPCLILCGANTDWTPL